MLYPAELRARGRSHSDSKAFPVVPKIKSSSFNLNGSAPKRQLWAYGGLAIPESAKAIPAVDISDD
jgi:hypothetical protein